MPDRNSFADYGSRTLLGGLLAWILKTTLGLIKIDISISYDYHDRFSRGSCQAVNNTVKLILSLYLMVSMAFWKKIYFVIAFVSAVFLAISLF